MAKKNVVQVDINSLVAEYSELGKREKEIKKRKDELSKLIKDFATKNGTKSDTGSFYCENDNFTYGSQARKSITLNFDSAKTFFVNKGLWSAVVIMKETINEDVVEKLVSEQVISMVELESITDTKLTYAIDVKEKKQEEEMPEVEVINVEKKSAFKKK